MHKVEVGDLEINAIQSAQNGYDKDLRLNRRQAHVALTHDRV